MEQVIIQDCGCIALPESIATVLDLRKGMTLEVALTDARDAILLTPLRGGSVRVEGSSYPTVPAASCVILPPSR